MKTRFSDAEPRARFRRGGFSINCKSVALLVGIALLVLVASRSDALPAAAQGGGVTTRVSIASDGTQGNNHSYGSSVSADGRYVAFASDASNLVPGDTNGKMDVFVHDRLTGQTTRVSVASDGTQGNELSRNPSISADGRYVAFSSLATNLVIGDTNGLEDVFVYDRASGQVMRVSVKSDGSQQNQGSSTRSSISSDGRYIAFESLFLTSNCTWGQIFVRDMQTGETTCISVNSSGVQGNHVSNAPSISANGQFITFMSFSNNLVLGDTNGMYDIFVYDRITGQTTRVSIASDGTQGNGHSWYPSISADGRYVAFASEASNLVPGDTNGKMDVFVHDRLAGQTTRVSVASDGTQGNNDSWYSFERYISADGRFIAFHSDATNLANNCNNGQFHIFIHDRHTGQTICASISSSGVQGDSGSSYPNISADGRYVAFQSVASNLVSNDTNGFRDVFVHDRRGGIPAAFLDLPFAYTPHTPARFAELAQKAYIFGGMVNSWFDHQYADYSTNGNLWPWWSTVPITDRVYGPPCLYSGNCYDGHNGIDFHVDPSAWTNTPVLAAAAGTVVKVNVCNPCSPGYGQYVDIYHPNGYITRYAHLATIAAGIMPGSTVTAGQQIGIMGWSGLPQESDRHLHFGLYRDVNNNQQADEPQEAVDPYGWDSQRNGTDPWTTRSGPTSYYLWLYPINTVSSYNPTSGVIITSPSGSTTVNVPPNAYLSTLTIDLTEGPVAAPSAQLRSTGRSFFINATPSGQSLRALASSSITLTAPATLTVNYMTADITHLAESSLGIYRWDDSAKVWNLLTTTVDTQNKKVTAQTNQFGDFALFALPLCPADIYEPNDDYSTANFVTTDGQPQSQLFDIANDQDWIKFNAVVGFTYVIRTSNLGANTDTVITLYERDGITPIATDDNSDGGKASRLTWRAPANGTYFINIQNASASVSGCSVTYDISIRGISPIFLPLIMR